MLTGGKFYKVVQENKSAFGLFTIISLIIVCCICCCCSSSSCGAYYMYNKSAADNVESFRITKARQPKNITRVNSQNSYRNNTQSANY